MLPDDLLRFPDALNRSPRSIPPTLRTPAITAVRRSIAPATVCLNIGIGQKHQSYQKNDTEPFLHDRCLLIFLTGNSSAGISESLPTHSAHIRTHVHHRAHTHHIAHASPCRKSITLCSFPHVVRQNPIVPYYQ
jgi:hypothetical protein